VGESGDFMVISPKKWRDKVGCDGDRVGRPVGTGDGKGGEKPKKGLKKQQMEREQARGQKPLFLCPNVAVARLWRRFGGTPVVDKNGRKTGLAGALWPML
jgi:hypothetical protein